VTLENGNVQVTDGPSAETKETETSFNAKRQGPK
jgi:hypothetical protein